MSANSTIFRMNVRTVARQLSTKASQKRVRGQSTLTAHVDASFSSPFGPSIFEQAKTAFGGASWADEANTWLAHRRAAEHASDVLTAQQLTASLSPRRAAAHSWKDEWTAWTDVVPAGAKLESTSYACLSAASVDSAAARPATHTWADETESWLAQRRRQEHTTDRMIAQEIVWFK
jgi:hypothetical protein